MFRSTPDANARPGLLLLLALAAPALCFFIPVDHPVYESIDMLAQYGRLPALDGYVRPLELERVAGAVKAADTSGMTDRERWYLNDITGYLTEARKLEKDNGILFDLHADGFGGYRDTLQYHNRAYIGAAYQYRRFSLVNRVSVDLTGEKDRFDHLDRLYKGDLAADVPQAYLAYSLPKFGVMLGRNKVTWGPGRNGHLILGGHMPPMNLVYLWTELGFFRAYSFSTRLNPVNADNRYFSASRVVIQLKKNAYVAFNQSVVYANRNRDFELYYVIPSFVYYFGTFSGTRTNRNDNLFVGADGEWKIKNRYSLYFEFLADDFQVDLDSKSRNTQNALAFLLGIDCPDLYKGLGAGAEITRVNSYVYKNMGDTSVHYIANLHGGTMGHPLGPDAEGLNVWLNYRFRTHGLLGLKYALARHGDLRNILDRWDAYGKAGDAIPHGTVENAHELLLQGGVVHYKGLSARVQAGYYRTDNYLNRSGDVDEGVTAGLKIDYCFDKLLQWNLRPTVFK